MTSACRARPAMRGRLAAWNSARHTRKAQEKLEEAARHFDEAFDAAERRYK